MRQIRSGAEGCSVREKVIIVLDTDVLIEVLDKGSRKGQQILILEKVLESGEEGCDDSCYNDQQQGKALHPRLKTLPTLNQARA